MTPNHGDVPITTFFTPFLYLFKMSVNPSWMPAMPMSRPTSVSTEAQASIGPALWLDPISPPGKETVWSLGCTPRNITAGRESAHSDLKRCGHSAENCAKLGSSTLSWAECQMPPGSVHSAEDGICTVLLREEDTAPAPVPPACLLCREQEQLVLACQLGRQKLHQVTGHRNVTSCLMRFSKLPVIWKGCVQARVRSLARPTPAARRGNKLSCNKCRY